jgi:NTP pyrophosphatase (non-canonical NTP hydrolase)
MQGIRGTTEEHAAEMKDAVADLIIFACDYATSMGWDLEVILADTWSEVKQRDFKAYPKNGRNA